MAIVEMDFAGGGSSEFTDYHTVVMSSSQATDMTIPSNSVRSFDIGTWAGKPESEGWKLLEMQARFTWSNSYYIKVYLNHNNRTVDSYQFSSGFNNVTVDTLITYTGNTRINITNSGSSELKVAMQCATFAK